MTPSPAFLNSGLIYTPRGILSFTAQPGVSTSSDYKITAPLLSMGERLYAAGAVFGDTFDMYLIDKDNVLNQGGTPDNPTIVAHLARGLYVIPNTFMKSDSPALPSPWMVGLYLRGVYTSVGQATVNVTLNMRTYEQYFDFIQDQG